MSEDRSLVRELSETVATLRDELRVQANLAQKDAKDELQRLEKRWHSVEQERNRLADIVEETAEESWAGIRLALEELRDGYRRLRSE